jgi:DNA-binding transcriptional LysR family regulator
MIRDQALADSFPARRRLVQRWQEDYSVQQTHAIALGEQDSCVGCIKPQGLPMDRLGNIEAFVHAVELGSFTRAAKRLGLSPSALSRRIAQLESETGVRLIDRTTRALRLSDEGRLFFERARGALESLDAAHAAVASARDRPAGLLRVEAPTILGHHVIVPALARFLARYPELRVDLSLRDHGSDLVSEGIDIALRMGALEDSSLIARSLGRTKMRVCGAPSYLKRRGTPKSVADLEKHDRLGLAVNGTALRWRLRDGSGIRELAPTSRVSVNNSEALIELACAGAGLVWFCDFMVARAQKSGALHEVLEHAACETAPIHALSLPGRRALPKVRAFTELVGRELEKNDVRVR